MTSVSNSLSCLRLVRKSIALNQQRTVVSGPPAQRISFAEKCAHGLVIVGAIFATPLWVASHMRSYRDRS